jgi:quinol monooxygenase YgiN
MGDAMIQASLRIVAPPAKRSEVMEVLRALKGPTEVTIGCQACRVLKDAENDDVLTYLVRWDTRRGLEEHLGTERFRRLLPFIDMSIEPPEFEISEVDLLGGIEFLVAVLESKSSK